MLKEFESISERGGVLGAMELGYQRGKIQEESLHYEHLKHTGEYPIIGVNTFRNPHGETVPRSHRAGALDRGGEAESAEAAAGVSEAPRQGSAEDAEAAAAGRDRNENVFAVLMDAVRVCSLGQITNALFEVGGQYRRSM